MQQELLAPHSWSSEEHSGEAELSGLELSEGWAAPGIGHQQPELQKRLKETKEAVSPAMQPKSSRLARSHRWKELGRGDLSVGHSLSTDVLIPHSVQFPLTKNGGSSEGQIHPVGHNNSAWHDPRCWRGVKSQEEQQTWESKGRCFPQEGWERGGVKSAVPSQM